jgi:SsrA-binding protein
MAKAKKKNTSAEAGGKQVIDVNKKARHDYEILDILEAGIVLSGSEVKSIRGNGISLRDSYVRLKNGECFLVDAHVAPYKFAAQDAHEPYRDRKLLLAKKEIGKLSVQVQAKGLSVVPLSIYFNAKGRCKLEIGVARGRKLHDKRQDIKEKEARRDIDRARRYEG